ncbi:hypothetical protein UFOVP785_62 [uncultured Caudovirales phage]|uniref:Uncharacterized protein n=1 Tax=uncultured Caudovirales phage TaxID=2100421 RepID=A0A6J5NS16_9CAUD|nr:hypothetical protein UFOVP785_62 [uncultured Caudovirales phage]
MTSAIMVSGRTNLSLLKALRERLEPLFVKYDTLDYLVLRTAYGSKPRAYSTTIEACFSGEMTPMDFSDVEEWDGVHKRDFKDLVFYQHYQRLMQGNEHLSPPPAGKMVIHRDPKQCTCK